MQSNGNSHSPLTGIKTVEPLWKTFWWFITKRNILLPYDPPIALVGTYPKELKTYVHTKTCTWMFTATLFIIAKSWRQPRCPSVGEWINKLWYIQTVEYYSALKRNELSSHEKTWRNFKCTLRSGISQSEKTTYCMKSITMAGKRSVRLEMDLGWGGF